MKFLIVDDKTDNRYILKELLISSGYEVEEAENGVEALEKLRANGCDMIISDILMPVMDGLQFCREVKEDDRFKNIPFIFQTAAYTEKRDEELALSLGVNGFIRKPIDPFEFIKTVHDIIGYMGKDSPIETSKPALGRKDEDFRLYSKRLVEKMEEKMAALTREVNERRKAEEALKISHEQLKKTLEGTINAVAKAVESRDLYIAGHQRRVAQLACAIAVEMGLDADRIEGIRLGALIHDIGKIHLPAEILGKPALLTKIERALIHDHSNVGYEILKDIEFPWPVAVIALQHHERMDGSGYPQGIKGDKIIQEARITSVADVVEAMASHRPYRPGLGIDAALQEIKDHKGGYYDPEAVNACCKLFREKEFAF